jgi:hypothetical protein
LLTRLRCAPTRVRVPIALVAEAAPWIIVAAELISLFILY